jgi:hypothetical protein
LIFNREGVTFALARACLAYVPPKPVVVTRLSRPDRLGYDLGRVLFWLGTHCGSGVILIDRQGATLECQGSQQAGKSAQKARAEAAAAELVKVKAGSKGQFCGARRRPAAFTMMWRYDAGV